jgi:hypothetical protein
VCDKAKGFGFDCVFGANGVSVESESVLRLTPYILLVKAVGGVRHAGANIII